MKIDFYIDVYPGMDPQYLSAYQTPSEKAPNTKRFRASINIPDWAFTGKIDGEAVVEEVVEVGKDD